jgi:hypothetical protein
MKIYICGGSSEMDLIADLMKKLRDMGHTITHDWVATIRSVGEANPRDVSHKTRAGWSDDDLRGVSDASLVWVVLPKKTSFGCAFEAGYAVGMGEHVIMSGDWRATIFSSRAESRFDTHEKALEWIRLYATRGVTEEQLDALEAD